MILVLPFLLHVLFISCVSESPVGMENSDKIIWPGDLPIYDHIVIVVEENKDYEEIIGNPCAPYINQISKEGANFTHMYGEEHFSQGNYFWLFSGSNQNVGFTDQVPTGVPFSTSNLGYQLIHNNYTFKGYAESLPEIGSTVANQGNYARKHVPWVSFSNVPNTTTVETSSNLRFKDFPGPSNYDSLPHVAFVIPNLDNDMHNCYSPNCPCDINPDCCTDYYINDQGEKIYDNCAIYKGDLWLKENIESYYQWAKEHNSLLILTFDENDDKRAYKGLTNPGVNPEDCKKQGWDYEYCIDLQNKIVTIFAGAHIKPGYTEDTPFTHVNILRTIEAMYGLPKSGAQQPNAAGTGITDDAIITDVFTPVTH
jgi:phosphatidylinositol-3-phosphatase